VTLGEGLGKGDPETVDQEVGDSNSPGGTSQISNLARYFLKAFPSKVALKVAERHTVQGGLMRLAPSGLGIMLPFSLEAPLDAARTLLPIFWIVLIFGSLMGEFRLGPAPRRSSR
jgi:hypothetical protein